MRRCRTMIPSSRAALRIGRAAAGEMERVSRTIAMMPSLARAFGAAMRRKSAPPLCASRCLASLKNKQYIRGGRRGSEGVQKDWFLVRQLLPEFMRVYHKVPSRAI
jgi:hypothetical protein